MDKKLEDFSDGGLYEVSLNSDIDENPKDVRVNMMDKDFKSLSVQNEERDCQSPDEAAEKSRIISQILELQNTLEDLSHRVDSVKEENLKLKSENQVLGKYIENLMSSSSVFQQASNKPKSK